MLKKFSVFLIVLMIIAGCSMPTADVNNDKSAGLQVIDGNSQEISKSVKLADLKDAQIYTEWKTTTANESITLPLESTGTYDCTVEWGDNSPKVKLTYATRIHVYAKAGIHIVIINGKFSGWSFNNQGDKLKIYQLFSWKNMNFGNSGGYFYGCKNLTIQTWDTPDLTGTTNMDSAFRDCSSILMVPNIQLWNITSISYGSFYGCSKLSSMIIPSSVTSIGKLAFGNCLGLTSITIPSSVTSIKEQAFTNCSKLGSISIPGGVTTIEDSVFHGCSKLTNMSIPNSVTSIGDHAISSCYELANITIPSNVTSIEDGAFFGDIKLNNMIIPAHVTNIGTDAFRSCYELSSVTVQATTPPVLGSTVFTSVSSSLVIKVPSASLAAYKQAPGWSEYASKIVGY